MVTMRARSAFLGRSLDGRQYNAPIDILAEYLASTGHLQNVAKSRPNSITAIIIAGVRCTRETIDICRTWPCALRHIFAVFAVHAVTRCECQSFLKKKYDSPRAHQYQ